MSVVDYRFDKEKQSRWFPYSISNVPNDFVMQNGVHARCREPNCNEHCNEDNPKYWQHVNINDLIRNDPKIGCFGCSFTYGVHLDETDTWPHLLQQALSRPTGNFGVCEGGADACLINLVNAHKKFGIQKAIVLFPVMERRLLQFQINDKFFQMPVGLHSEWTYSESIAKNHFDKKFITEKIDVIKRQIVSDDKNNYSKQKILQTKDFCDRNNIELFVSSWNWEVRQYLKSNGFELISFYDMSVSKDRTGDGQHPARAHNVDWVSKILPDIL
jgi:hypothetical protein